MMTQTFLSDRSCGLNAGDDDLIEQFGSFEEVVGLSIQFDSFEYFIFLDQSLGILDKQRVDIPAVVAMSQLYRNVPLVQLDAGVNCLLDFVGLSDRI